MAKRSLCAQFFLAVYPVVFVGVLMVPLLSIWVATPFCDPRPWIRLPPAEGSFLVADQRQLAVTITADGTIYLLNRRVSRRELAYSFRDMRDRGMFKTIVVRCDRRATFGTIKAILGAASDVGMSDFFLETSLPDGSPLAGPGPSA